MTHRNTILVEEGEILSQQAYAGDQFILRLKAPRIAQRAQAGSFIHLECDRSLPMRRPLSIMRTDPKGGWIELLYRVFGVGTRLLSAHAPGVRLSVMGPIGRPFVLHPQRPRTLLLGGGVGIPPMIFLVEEMRKSGNDYAPLVLMGSEVPFPYTTRPSQILVSGVPEGTIAAMPLMDDWGVPSRLASLQGYPGCFPGYVTDLARHWLEALPRSQHREVEIFACGPHPMLEATARLARDYDLPCQISLEEFMACAVGGCAGCTVQIRTPDGMAMKRVCVDGPVFEAASVVF